MSFWGKVGSVGKLALKGGVGFATGGPAGAALAVGSSLLNRKKKPGVADPPVGAAPVAGGAPAAGGPDFRSMTDQEAQRAKTLTAGSDAGMASFDPSQYTAQAAGAQAKQFGEVAKGLEANRNVSTARRGFLGSPIGSGAMGRDLNQRIATTVAANAQTQAGQRLGQLNSMAGTAENAQSRAFEAKSDIENTARATQETNAANAAQAKRSKIGLIGKIGGAVIGAAGTYLARRKGVAAAG